jgi:hypothetical protein
MLQDGAPPSALGAADDLVPVNNNVMAAAAAETEQRLIGAIGHVAPQMCVDAMTGKE